jgi:hypothetical protein
MLFVLTVQGYDTWRTGAGTDELQQHGFLALGIVVEAVIVGELIRCVSQLATMLLCSVHSAA